MASSGKRARCYCFTVNNPDLKKLAQVQVKLRSVTTWYVFQLERGDGEDPLQPTDAGEDRRLPEHRELVQGEPHRGRQVDDESTCSDATDDADRNRRSLRECSVSDEGESADLSQPPEGWWSELRKPPIAFDDDESSMECNELLEEPEIRGTEHYQGTCYFKSPKSWKAAVKALQGIFEIKCNVKECWSTPAKAAAYCAKEETRLNGPFSHGTIPVSRSAGKRHRKWGVDARPIVDDFDEAQKTKWQEDVLQLVSKPPDRRTVVYVWSEDGAIGKSTLARSLLIRYRHRSIGVSGRAGDILYGVAKFVEDGRDLWLVVLDVPRTNQQYVSYQAIECLKNGALYSTKFESKELLLPTVHVVIFANSPPDKYKMSSDRWHVIHVATPLRVPKPSLQEQRANLKRKR